ncbi:MAG: cyclodeaminase/cyclohydrolase family protein, partial [Coriobacteriales bacterium]|nr:cyclodeaminase/cyclohydrolase family protein [Coriobacteriales bacterium]
IGSALAISDAGCGAVCCKAGLQAASFNVFINTKAMTDREYAESLEKEANELLDKYCPLADEIYQVVDNRIRG